MVRLLTVTIILLLSTSLIAGNINEELIKAASFGQTKKVNKLIASGANLNSTNEKGNTALMEAAKWGRTKMSLLLIRSGTNKNLRNNAGKTASDIAKKEGYSRTAKAISKTKIGKVKIVKSISTSSPVIVVSSKKLKKFWEAAENGQGNLVRKFLQSGININSKDANGDTALTRASKWGRTNVVKFLIKNGASKYLKNNKGETALSIADNEGHRSIVKILKKISGKIVAHK